MTPTSSTLRLLAAALLLPSAASAQLSTDPPRDPTAPLTAVTRARIDSAFAHVDRTDSPGCALGVSRNGVTLYERGYGMSDLQHGLSLSPGSIFHVASISKQFAAISVALLAEDGKLSLDDDVRKHVPELPDHGPGVTIRRLIHHTSGLRDQWNLLALAGWRFPEDLITERDVLGIVGRQRGLNFKPGDEYAYSNTGYTLLAVIVHRVSGQTLRQFADARIFRPLGMQQTHFHDDHAMIVPGRTSAYARRPNGSWRISIPVFNTYGATSLFTTTGDLLKWMAHLDAPRFGSPELWRAAETSGVLHSGSPTNYGYGLAMGTWRGLRTVGHGGADAGYRANVERFPSEGLAIAVLCNLSTGVPGELSRRVASVVLADRLAMEEVTVRAPEHRPDRAVLDRWVGVYRDTVNHAVLRVGLTGESLFANNQRLELGSDSTGTTQNMGGWFVLRQPRSGPSEISVAPRGMRQVTFVRQADPVAPRAYAAYAGSYYSQELDVTYVIAQRGDVLVRSHRKLEDATLAPAGRDAFTVGGTTVLFSRDRRGRVTGYTINDARVRGVRFERVP